MYYLQFQYTGDLGAYTLKITGDYYILRNLPSTGFQMMHIKNMLTNSGDSRGASLIPESGRSPGVRNGNPLQYSCPRNPMDRGEWWSAVHAATKSWTRLRNWAHLEVQLWTEVAQLCPAVCDPMDCSLPGFSVHEIFQAVVLEWIAISFSRGSSQPRDRT